MKGLARRLLLEALARFTTEASAGLPALTYHSIDASGSAVSFPATSFRAQIAWLASQGFRSLTATQAAETLSAGQVPPKSIVLTFDDGFVSVREAAFPVLAEYGFVATVF
jgi:peptidoglycan/xylan/chitin deacetylase (PgdA/CDA1 family)